VTLCRHKGSQHTALAAAGVPVAGHARVTGTAAALEAADRIGLPVVLKPADGSGSTGVRLCRSRAEITVHAARLLARTHNERGIPTAPGFLVESYVEGPEYSVEVFEHTAVTVVGKHLGPAPHFVETGHDVPAPVATADAEALADTAVAAVKALGLGFGAAHVELRLTTEGPVLIEVNPRLGGGMIPELIRSALSVDLVSAQVAAALGRPADLEPRTAHHAALRFLVVEEPAALDASFTVPDPPRHVTALTLTGRGGVPLAPQHDHRDRVGHATATAATAGEAARAAGDALTLLRTALRPRSTEESQA
jgi:argininosuccinate lyase